MNAHQDDFKSLNLKNTRRLGFRTLAWVLSVALVSFGPKFLWDFDKTLSALAILLNIAMGIMMILAHRTMVNGLDELQRKIQIDAMAIALGVGVVGGLAYSLMDATNLIPWDAEISFVVMLIGITYLVTILINHKRYS